MVQPIMKDEAFLRLPSQAAGPEDLQTAQDLLDTLAANAEGCVGMAANMIGVSKRIIAVNYAGTPLVLFNPEIIRARDAFEADEGCLSLLGTRKIRRFKYIKLRYQNSRFQPRIKSFTGWTAQIIQHEVDHCNGVLI